MLKRYVAIALAMAVIGAVIALYAPSRGAALVWDDHYLVEQDARCRDDVLACFGVSYIPQSPFRDVATVYYRPVVTASFALVADLGGGAVGQHVVNLLLHALNAALVFALARRFGAKPARAAAFAVAWAFHPRLVEAVTWVAGRTDLLAAACVLGALLAWPFEAWSPRRAAGACVLVGLGLFSKEVALAGVLAIVAMAWRAGGGASFRRVAWLAVPVVVYAACRLAVVGARVPPSSLTTGQRLAAVPEAAARYVEMAVRFVSPWSAHGAIGVPDGARVAIGVAVLGALAWACARAWRSTKPGVVVGAALGATSLLAVLQIVPIGLHGAVTGDRLLYLPLAGLVVAVACALPTSKSADRLFVAAALALAVAEAPFARRAQRAFDDEVTFWLTLAERADADNAGPRSAIATVARDDGAPEVACPLFDSARRTLARTGRRGGAAYSRATENAGACLGQTARYDESVAVYRALAEDRPASGRVALGLAYALLHRLDFAEANASFRRAGELDARLGDLARRMQVETERATRDRAALDAADPAVRARYAASVGRGPDAERAWLAVALDASASPAARREAVAYLANDATPPSAVAALRSVPDASLAPLVARRAASYEDVMRRRDRILALAR